MRPRPGLVSAALILMAIIQTYWGIQTLLNGSIFFAASQFAAASGFILAGVGTRYRSTLATGLAVAAAAILLRAPIMFPMVPTFAITVGVLGIATAIAAWGAHSLDRTPTRTGTLALRGGFAAMAVTYLGVSVLVIQYGGAPTDLIDLALLTLAATANAIFIDAPPLTGQSKRKAFPDTGPMRSP